MRIYNVFELFKCIFVIIFGNGKKIIKRRVNL